MVNGWSMDQAGPSGGFGDLGASGRAVQLSKTPILPSKTPGAGRLRKLGDPRRPPP
jgi:hypothetical protein